MNRSITLDRKIDRSPNSQRASELEMRQPCVVLPLLENALPLARLRIDGQLRKYEPPQVVIECSLTKAISPGRSLAVGVARADHQAEYAAVIVDEVRPSVDNQVTLVGHVGGALQDILERETIRPSINPDNFRFEHDVSRRILDRLADIGILERAIVDRIQVCPKCSGIPVHRSVCHACGSPRVMADELIHHFACAYVDSVDQFLHGNILRCPKCQMGPLIVGSDFEYLPGLHTCLGCSRIGSRVLLTAQCTYCHYDFSLDESAPHDLVGYHANRLDSATLSSL